ncbi:MAG: hypothetical protein ABH869_06825 [Candidatus Omnitrophota bacterium]
MKCRILKKRLLKELAIKILVSIFSVSAISISPSHSETGFIYPQKGMCYVTWDKTRFATPYSDESLKKLVSLGVEYVSITPTLYQEDYNSTEIKLTPRSPSTLSIIHVIKHAHSLGMKVMIKPHIDLINKFNGTYWRADIGFNSETDWQKWFKEYNDFIIDYARISEKYNVELFCVGTELAFTAQKEKYWRKIISSVRKIYSGKITYAANWDNYNNINFWDSLDFIGINAYFPLSYKKEPSLTDLTQGWEKWKYEIQACSKRTKKQIIFTELGYPCAEHAAYYPWKNAYTGNANTKIQENCYKAFFKAIWNEPWFAGVYWWKWGVSIHSGGQNDRQFTPQNKPAQAIIKNHYNPSGVYNENI